MSLWLPLLALPLLAACRTEGPTVHLAVAFTQPAPPPAHQALVRQGLDALFRQATGLPTAAATVVPQKRHLQLTWSDDGRRIRLEARPARGDGRLHLTIRRSDTSRRRHAGTTAFLRQVRDDFLPPAAAYRTGARP